MKPIILKNDNVCQLLSHFIERASYNAIFVLILYTALIKCHFSLKPFMHPIV